MEHAATHSHGGDAPGTSSTNALELLQTLERVENCLTRQMNAAKRLKDCLAKTRKSVSERAKPIAALNALLTELREAAPDLVPPDTERLLASVQSQLAGIKNQIESSFGDELRNAAESAGLQLRQTPDGYVLGAFAVTVNMPKEAVAVRYAKSELERGLPLDPAAIVRRIQQLERDVLQEPGNIKKTADELEEAIRVAVARQKSGSHVLRAELPAVYREMALIRQGSSKAAKGGEYSQARFVVEVKSVVESDHNISAHHRFRLEAAVIENAGNSKKSIFIPDDLSRGAGEGKFYQAIALLT